MPHLGLCTLQQFEVMAPTLSCRLNTESERQDGMGTAAREQKNLGESQLVFNLL